MKFAQRFVCTLLIASLACAAARAADAPNSKGWFGAGNSKASSAKTKNAAAATPSKASRAIASVTSAPKRLMSNTKNLFASKQPAPAPPKRSGTTTTRSSKSGKTAKQPEKGFFGSMFSPAEPEPPKTIGDWMKLKPVRP